ncbi:hypothetical protein KCX62_01295 [Francisella tularensis]|nr:hypothetical protein KCX62_01295 [Francisella tularensis]
MHKKVGSRIQIRRHREDNFSTVETFSSSGDSAIVMFNQKSNLKVTLLKHSSPSAQNSSIYNIKTVSYKKYLNSITNTGVNYDR